MTIFLTGGSGKTSRRIAAEIKAISPSTPVLCSSRSAPSEDPNTARFDWSDSSTYENPFKHPISASSPVTAIYVVLPSVNDPLPEVKAFLDVAIKQNESNNNNNNNNNNSSSEKTETETKSPLTVVLLSSDTLEPSPESPAPHARVHQYLIDLSQSHSRPQSQILQPPPIHYAILRPSFFMQNFTEQQHRVTIANPAERTIYTATGAGQEPFVSAQDIAAVGARCLLGKLPLDRDYVIHGPEMLSYGDVARIISQVTEKSVSHTNLTTQQLVRRYVETAGLPVAYAEMLAGLDEGIRRRAEEVEGTETSQGSETAEGTEGKGKGQRRPDDTVEKVLGRKSLSFEQFARENRDAWL